MALLAQGACGGLTSRLPPPGVNDSVVSAPTEDRVRVHARATRSQSPPPRPRAWRYDISTNEQLSHLDVRLCFEGPAAGALVAGQSPALAFVSDVRVHGSVSTAPLVARDGRISFPSLVDDACLDYRFDVDAALARHDRGLMYRVGPSLVIAHDVWLRPAEYDENAQVKARIDVPDGLALSAPWGSSGDPAYPLSWPTSTFRRRGQAAIGPFTVRAVPLVGGQLDVAVLPGAGANVLDEHLVYRWLSEAGASVSTLYGRFPRTRTQVLVEPVGSGAGALFGLVVRGGEPSVHLLVGPWSDDESLSLREDWVAVHEMSHLAMPMLSRGESWLGEGIATWYQHILRVRSGALTEQQGWQRLVEGFARGRRSLTGRSLLEDSRRMAETGAYWRVYWAGAALAMVIDVTLRLESDGRLSLDETLARASACCLDNERIYRGAELCEVFDRELGTDVFTRVARAGLAEADFPVVEGLLHELGVDTAGERVSLREDAPLSLLRRQIMRGKQEVQ